MPGRRVLLQSRDSSAVRLTRGLSVPLGLLMPSVRATAYKVCGVLDSECIVQRARSLSRAAVAADEVLGGGEVRGLVLGGSEVWRVGELEAAQLGDSEPRPIH